jgi:uncharacterized membrane protein (TIGR02234 family)
MRKGTLTFGCLFIGGALALVASEQPWWRATGEGVVLRVSGTQATGGLSQALAIVALAGTLLLLALQTRGRRITGGLLLLVGVGLAVVGGVGLQPSADAVRGQAHEVSLAETFDLSVTVWPWVFTAAGVLVAVAAVLTMIKAGAWAAHSDRLPPAPGKGEALASEDPAELWKAMDAGVDPTADVRATGIAEDHDTAKVPYPNVHDPDPGATMDGTEGRRGSQQRDG